MANQSSVCATLMTTKAVLRIRIRICTEPHHFAGSGILEADPDLDPRLQNLHLRVINLFSVEKYCE
jgi:hypothetical protein